MLLGLPAMQIYHYLNNGTRLINYRWHQVLSWEVFDILWTPISIKRLTTELNGQDTEGYDTGHRGRQQKSLLNGQDTEEDLCLYVLIFKMLQVHHKTPSKRRAPSKSISNIRELVQFSSDHINTRYLQFLHQSDKTWNTINIRGWHFFSKNATNN